MSGSSLDGLDMALCTFQSFPDPLPWTIQLAETLPYSADWKSRLQNAPGLSGWELMKLDADLGTHIGEQVKKWLTDHQLKPGLIASHGHTVFHEPGSNFTTQIGSGAHIVAASGMDTITSFRSSDVAHGGQGAPFAPVADMHLFSGYQGYLNLGGIANVTLQDVSGEWKAWDIGPCNQALNFLAEKTGQAYDRDGKIAAAGVIHPGIVADLISMYPVPDVKVKSLSNAAVLSSWIAYLGKSGLPVADLLASVTTAIAQLVHHHISSSTRLPANILVTGGGAHHPVLVNHIKRLGEPIELIYQLPQPIVIDYKESLLMAYLGYLTMHHVPYGIYRLTGAAFDSIGGAYHMAK